MAAQILQKSLCFADKPTYLFFKGSAFRAQLCIRGLKNHMLFKKKKKPKIKVRDGKEYTVEHLYWERYFKDNPEILNAREVLNMKNARASGNKPLSPNRIYEILTTSDKR